MKRIVFFALLTLMSIGAFSQCYTRVWIRMLPYPQDGGKVKISVESSASILADDVHFQTMVSVNYIPENFNIIDISDYNNVTTISLFETGWGNSAEFDIEVFPSFHYDKFIEQVSYSGDLSYNYFSVVYIANAEANEGFYFLGFSRSIYKDYIKIEKPEDAGPNWQEPHFEYLHDYDTGYLENPFKYPETSFTFSTKIVQKDNPGYMVIPSGQLAFWFENYIKPETPNERCYALFARVIVEDNEGGTAIIANNSDEQSDVTNDLGDEVTITAVADDERYPFLYWIEKSTGRQITENPYTFNVTHQDTYTPYFAVESTDIKESTDYPILTLNTYNIYTLDGRCLKTVPQKGIYIVKNRKVLK